MEQEVVRSRRLRKKLYLGEFAILGFEFTCRVSADPKAGYEPFLDSLRELVEERNLYISMDNDDDLFIGFVTSGDRYGNATEEDREALKQVLKDSTMVRDIMTGNLVDAFYDM